MTHPRFKALLDLVPAPGAQPGWDRIEAELGPFAHRMEACPQDPRHHSEGCVLVHTRMVVDALVSDPAWAGREAKDRERLFWAAVLHDIGKPATTRIEEDGSITSRGHSRAGAAIAREFLRAHRAPFHWREAICGLIASHQLPFWLIERDTGSRLAIETSWTCNSADLCLHAQADARGRVCEDKEDLLTRIALAKALFEEERCFGERRAFANDASRIEWAMRGDRDPDYAAHEDYSCTALMMSALPGSGKDSWIAANMPDLPVVSLDDIRLEMGVGATDNQGRVIQEARERARAHLRAGQDFIWNATNITRQIRTPILSLFRDYGARTRIVYIEVDDDRLRTQNTGRAAAVPGHVMDKLAAKLEPPTLLEAHQVDFIV